MNPLGQPVVIEIVLHVNSAWPRILKAKDQVQEAQGESSKAQCQAFKDIRLGAGSLRPTICFSYLMTMRSLAIERISLISTIPTWLRHRQLLVPS
jgi:hypothetical protein